MRSVTRSSETQSKTELTNFRYALKKRSSFSKQPLSNNVLHTTTCSNDESKHVDEKLGAVTRAESNKAKIGTFFSSQTAPQNSIVAVSSGGGDASTSGGRSLLKHVFRLENSSNASPSAPDKSNGSTRKAGTEHAMSALAHCRAFTPLEQRKITSSQSAFALSSTSSSASTQCDSLEPPAPPPFSSDAGGGARGVGSKPAVKPKPLALRRERSDLSGVGVARIAAHYMDYGSSAVGIRRALVPPSACLDESILRNCLEELKKKRQEASSETADPRSCQQQKEERNLGEAFGENSFGNANVVLRTRPSESFRTDQRRLSVPNLADLTHSALTSGLNNGVVAAAKALTSKLGRNPGTGELQRFAENLISFTRNDFQTINEGLVTPVVRRKQYMKDAQTYDITNNWSPSLLQKPSPPYKKIAKQTQQQERLRSGAHSGVTEQIFTRKSVFFFSHIGVVFLPRLILLAFYFAMNLNAELPVTGVKTLLRNFCKAFGTVFRLLDAE
ncbi:unnamed protein product [Gongylonema pulchrum]|uniref:Uncharacterized protein n=1 Tax=Gongylonema pulchrum TaxID=637853 RepID=A0A3P7MAI6_9BILA|nr:unnamed protein product [Gongylonema pulchrum]